MGVGCAVRFPLARAAELGQLVLQVLQAHHIGIVDQVDGVGYRVDVDFVHAGKPSNAILRTAGAIWTQVIFKS
jgi:hypothetical protein